jgi:hypothetical protein
MSLLHHVNKGTRMNYLEQPYIQLHNYIDKPISQQNAGERNPLLQLAYDLQLQHAIT